MRAPFGKRLQGNVIDLRDMGLQMMPGPGWYLEAKGGWLSTIENMNKFKKTAAHILLFCNDLGIQHKKRLERGLPGRDGGTNVEFVRE